MGSYIIPRKIGVRTGAYIGLCTIGLYMHRYEHLFLFFGLERERERQADRQTYRDRERSYK